MFSKQRLQDSVGICCIIVLLLNMFIFFVPETPELPKTMEDRSIQALGGEAGGDVEAEVVVEPGLSRRLPGAIVVGVMKCGTGALLEMLRMHPQVRIHH